MKNNALEKEVIQLLHTLKSNLSYHDRGVILGLIFSCIPLFPISLFGLLISLLNLYLFKKNKLELGELKLIKLAILIGVINSIFSLLLFVYIYSLVSNINWGSLIEAGKHKLVYIYGYLQDLIPGRRSHEVFL